MNIKTKHEKYIKRCFTLALRGSKSVKTNPKVGALLVHKERIIGEGYHQQFGQEHAEVNALNDVKAEDRKFISQSTLYVSLEPCCFTGKTGACTDLILKNSIEKVVISTQDPNLKVHGKGIEILRQKGVDVTTGILENHGRFIIRDFELLQTQERPFITLKWAKSQDNFIGQEGKSIAISNTQSQLFVHRLRANNDGILIGANTAIVDNPKLTNRLSTGDSPLRIVLDSDNKTPSDTYLKTDNHKTLIYTATSVESKNNVEFVESDMQLERILKDLYSKGIYRLMIEGGPTILKSFIKAKLWDEAYVITGPIRLENGLKSPNLKGQLIEKYQLDQDIIHRIIPDSVKYR